MSRPSSAVEAVSPGQGGPLAPQAAGRLLERAAQGDARAWEELVRSYVGLVWTVARSHQLGPDDVADVVQVTWLRLLEHADRLHEPDRVGAWLVTTARRESLRVLRRSRREVAVPEVYEIAPGGADGEVLDGCLTEELVERIRGAFVQLSPRSQALMRLLLADPAPSYADIARALDMPVGSIGPTRGRCLKVLREHLALQPA